jgi:hypothetical protein
MVDGARGRGGWRPSTRVGVPAPPRAWGSQSTDRGGALRVMRSLPAFVRQTVGSTSSLETATAGLQSIL